MSVKTYTGSCHCKAVTYEAQIDLEAGTGKCNCSFCFKARWWGIIIKPAAFTQLTGHDALTRYQRNPKGAEHLFCKHCGVRPFERGNIPEAGGAYVAINAACVDNLDPQALGTARVRYFDGLNNNWMNAPAYTAHL